MAAIEDLGYSVLFVLALDVAASHLFNKNNETYRLMGRDLTQGEFIDYYKELCKVYPIVSIEDPLEQEDFEGFAELTRTLGIQIIGDDLFVTNIKRLEWR